MSFPLSIGDRVVPDPPAMAALVRSDCGETSGTVVPGKRPAQWVSDLVGEGRFERKLAIGLAAALIQNPEPATVAEGARLAVALGDGLLGSLMLKALDGHDAALLLSADPGAPGSSVEDALLGAASALVDPTDPLVRGPLLERLRNAGLRDLELKVLLHYGDARELEIWLPAVLTEGMSGEQLVLVGAVLAEGGPRAEVVRGILPR